MTSGAHDIRQREAATRLLRRPGAQRQRPRRQARSARRRWQPTAAPPGAQGSDLGAERGAPNAECEAARRRSASPQLLRHQLCRVRRRHLSDFPPLQARALHRALDATLTLTPTPTLTLTLTRCPVRERIAAFSGDDLDMLEPLQVLTGLGLG